MGKQRRILVDARTPVHYTMFAPVHRLLSLDDRVRFSFVASDQPAAAARIFRDAGASAEIVSPARAALTKFDAYITSDFTWTRLARGTCRIQMFHGVGGKYGFDAPTESLRAWHRLFFVNRRRLDNCVAAGAVDRDSPAIRLIGMPKVDCLVDGTLNRAAALVALGLPAERPTILYAPTWSPASSLNSLGIDLIDRLLQLPVNLIVKLHDRSRDPRPQYSGGIDWAAAVGPRLPRDRAVLAGAANITPCLAAADVMITDHSSAGFEYLLLDRPLVRIHVPALIELANIHRDYVQLLSDVSESVEGPADAVAAVERALADPHARSEARRTVAADLFYQPGGATARCAHAVYEAIELDPRPLRVNAPDGKRALRPGGTAALRPGGTTAAAVRVRPEAATLSGPPAVSVIMPAYDAAAYLPAAIDSVLRQTFASLELLVVDDGSTDDTLKVAEGYASVDPRVRMCSQPNGGPGRARNTGFRHARGRYLAFLDSDDEWDETFLAEQIAMLEGRPDIDVLVANARNRGGAGHGRPARPVRGRGQPIPLAEMLADETCLFIMSVFRREVIEPIGGFDPALLTNEEYEMWIRAALAGFTFARNPAPLGWYACRPGSLSSVDTRMLSGILRVFAKTRPALPVSAPERVIIDRQIARFEAELAAAEARAALRRGDTRTAARHLAVLRQHRGGWALAAAERLCAHAPGAALAAARVRERLRGLA